MEKNARPDVYDTCHFKFTPKMMRAIPPISQIKISAQPVPETPSRPDVKQSLFKMFIELGLNMPFYGAGKGRTSGSKPNIQAFKRQWSCITFENSSHGSECGINHVLTLPISYCYHISEIRRRLQTDKHSLISDQIGE